MKPGRELDVLVAEKVMGILIKSGPLTILANPDLEDNEYYLTKYASSLIPHYSSNISDAWLVVEKMNRYKFELIRESDWRNDGKNPPDQLPEDTECDTYYFFKYTATFFSAFVNDSSIVTSEESAAHAICLAALKAKKKSPEDEDQEA